MVLIITKKSSNGIHYSLWSGNDFFFTLERAVKNLIKRRIIKMITKYIHETFYFIDEFGILYGHGISLTFNHTLILFFTNSVIMVWRFLHVSKSTIVSSNIAHNLAMSQGIAYQRRQSKILRITCRQNKTLYHQQLQRNVIISEFLFMFCTFTQGILLGKNAIPR